MLFFMLIVVIILAIVSLRVCDKDMMSPGFLASAMLILSIVFSFVNYNIWELGEYGAEATIIILIGISCFVFTSMISYKVKLIFGKEMRLVAANDYQTSDIQNKEIEIGTIELWILVAICLFTLAYYYLYMMRVAGGISVSAAIQALRSLRQTGDLSDSDSLPTLLNLFIKTVSAISLCCTYVFFYNRRINRKYKNYALFLPVVIMVPLSLLQSSRNVLIQYAISAVVAWYYVRRIGEKKNVLNKKLIKIVTRVILVAAPLFVMSIVFMGRTSSLSDTNGIYYISVYVSGGLRNFDLYLKQGGEVCTYWGEETFVALNNYLNGYFGGGKALTFIRHLEFRFANGWGAGNIYTSFRRFYHDFGLVGVAFLSGTQGLVSGSLSKKVAHQKNIKAPFCLFLYAFFAYTIIYIPIDDLFFSSVVSPAGILRIIDLYLVYFFIFKTKPL